MKHAIRIIVILLSSLVILATLIFVVASAFTDRSLLARVIVWQDSDVGDWERFPARTIENAPPISPLEHLADDNPYAQALQTLAASEGAAPQSLDTLLAENGTGAFIVVLNDQMVLERYYNGYTADSTYTSFSVAKSFASALVGIAIQQGAISSVNDPITRYLPELADRDPRFDQITIRHLLTMSSGLRYIEDDNPIDDGTRTYYDPNLRQLALSAEITQAPGQTFLYNNYNPLLVGMILERATGQPVATYLQDQLWARCGMEAPASWSLDSTADGFEKMESGINAHALDFVRFGLLYLHEGNCNGQQVIPSEWVQESTRADPSTDPAEDYQYFWWVTPNSEGTSHYYAHGNFGQFLYLIPEQNLLIARLGSSYGTLDPEAWVSLFEAVGRQINAVDTDQTG